MQWEAIGGFQTWVKQRNTHNNTFLRKPEIGPDLEKQDPLFTLEPGLIASGWLKSTRASLQPANGQLPNGNRSRSSLWPGQSGCGVKRMVVFSGPVGRMWSLKEIAVLCINTEVSPGPAELTRGTHACDCPWRLVFHCLAALYPKAMSEAISEFAMILCLWSPEVSLSLLETSFQGRFGGSTN